MHDEELISRVCRTAAGFLELGNEVIKADGARFVRSTATPRRYDANHAHLIRAGGDNFERVLARADEVFAPLPYRRFDIDPLTPPDFVARLALAGYTASHEIRLLLEGDLRAEPRPCDIRPIESDAGWAAFEPLSALDWEETTTRQGRPFERELLVEFNAYKRAKMPAVRYWLAYVDGEAAAYFSSWPGIDGLGMVEDLFTKQEYRHRGLATALIAHCVADARTRGAREVLIGADPTDTPMHMYAAMGFRPLMMTSQYFKQVDESR
jgi:GNAT superfamily N-acetyltransferase